MNDADPSSDKTTPDLEATPAAAAPDTPQSAAVTTEIPTATPDSTAQRSPRRKRELVAAGAAGLLVVGGLAGFGIGRATSGDDGPRFDRSGQFGPGQHGFGPGHRGFGGPGHRMGPPGNGQGGMPNGPSDGQPGGQQQPPTTDNNSGTGST
jgi:hypothetical protein